MFFSRNTKNNVYPFKPQFYYIKVGFKGIKTIKVRFRDSNGQLGEPKYQISKTWAFLFKTRIFKGFC